MNNWEVTADALDSLVDTVAIGVSRDSAEHRDGKRQKEWVERWLENRRHESPDDEWPFLVETRKGDERGKYGRYIGRLIHRDSEWCLNDALKIQFPEVADE